MFRRQSWLLAGSAGDRHERHPERFQRVLEGSQRITRSVEINAEAVREWGLIKDRIILDIAEEDQSARGTC
jgi:hypothetical protein